MSDQLLYTIAGENYVLIEDVAIDSITAKKLQAKVKKFECIIQGVKELRRGWFSSQAIIRILVPERNILEYNKQ